MRADEAEARQHLQHISYREYAQGPDDPRYYDPSAFGRLQRADPGLEPEQNRLLFCDGVMASSVTVFLWKPRFNGRTPLAGLIGGVCTHPDYRGRGFIKVLMTDVVQFMVGRGCALSWLHGKDQVYGSSGYRSFHGYSTLTIDVDPTRNPTPPSVTVRPADRERDVLSLMRIYDRWNVDLSGPMLRSCEDWYHRVLGPEAREGWDRFHVVESGERMIGYYQVLAGGTVGELGAADEASALVTLAALAQACGGRVPFSFCDPRMERAAQDLSGTATRTDGVRHGMWRLFDPEGVGLEKAEDDSGSGTESGTEALLGLLGRLDFVYYRMDRF